VLTAGEASVLNQVLGENLRNNFAAQVKKAKADGNTDGLAAAFDAYAAGYEFHGRRPSRAPVDPVAKEAHKIAKSLVLEALRKRNIDTKTLPEGKLDELIGGVLASKPEITAEAQRRIEATKSVAADALDGLV
jgi:hypothetical protein